MSSEQQEPLLDMSIPQEDKAQSDHSEPAELLTLENVPISRDEGLMADLDFQAALKKYLGMGVMKTIQNETHRKAYRKFMGQEVTSQLGEILFNIVYLVKFGEQQQRECMLTLDLGEVLAVKRTQLGESYTQLYSQLVSVEVMNYLLFSLAFVTHMLFFQTFKLDRQQFSLRFILDCYHIVIFEVNGVYVSDYYLQVQFEKIFTSKFLMYEQEDVKKYSKKIESQSRDKYHFLGRKLNYEEALEKAWGVDYGEDFARKLHGSLKVQDKPRQKAQPAPRQREEEAVDISHNYSRSHSLSGLRNELSTGRLRLNCIQISPTVSQFLENNKMVLPNRRNKLILHTLEKMDQHSLQDMQHRQSLFHAQLKQFNKEKKTMSTQPKSLSKSIVDIYKVKVDYDYKAQKFPQFFRDMEEHYEIFKKHQQKVEHLPSSKKMFENLNYLQLNQIDNEEDKQKRFEKLDDKEKIETILQLRDMSNLTEAQNRERLRRLLADDLNKIEENPDEAETNRIMNPPAPPRQKGCYGLPPISEQNLNRFTKTYIQNMNVLLGGREERIQDVYNRHLGKQYQAKYSKYIKDDHDENIITLKKKILAKNHLMQNNLSKMIKKKKI